MREHYTPNSTRKSRRVSGEQVSALPPGHAVLTYHLGRVWYHLRQKSDRRFSWNFGVVLEEKSKHA
jgi:hypothetical protein